MRQESLGKIGCGVGTDTDSLNLAHGGARVASVDNRLKAPGPDAMVRDSNEYLYLFSFQSLADVSRHALSPIPSPVLVHSYFSTAKPFCTRSSIVHHPRSRLHLPLQAGGFPLTGSERRTTQRFQMRLPLTVRWTTGAAVGETATESRDVSSRGVYFFLSKDVREGSPVEILLTLPNEITLAGPVRVRCLGRVQRTEPRDEGSIGVVAAIERYEFLRASEDMRQ